MNPENGFIITIGQNPLDRVNVLVYADWLHEHYDLPYFRALIRAARCARSSWIHTLAREAKKLLEPGTWTANEVEYILRGSFAVSFVPDRKVLLAPIKRLRPPRLLPDPVSGQYLHSAYVLVSPAWVIKHIEDVKVALAEDAPCPGAGEEPL